MVPNNMAATVRQFLNTQHRCLVGLNRTGDRPHDRFIQRHRRLLDGGQRTTDSLEVGPAESQPHSRLHNQGNVGLLSEERSGEIYRKDSFNPMVSFPVAVPGSASVFSMTLLKKTAPLRIFALGV